MVMLVEYKGGSGGHSFDVDIDEADLPSRGEAVGELSKPVTGIHARAKRIPPEMTAQALDNEPFEDYPRAVYGYKRLCGAGGDARDRFNQSYRHGIEHFLRRTFHGLTFVPGISFDIGEILEQQEREALKAVRDRYYSANMRRQVKSLEESYDGLCALRSVFGSASQKNCFSMETVVPTRYLPELLVAAPVWFIQEKRKTPQHFVGAGSSTVRYFCDLGVTDEFAYLFQMYNNGQRLFSEFEGRDVMPLPIAELVGKVRKLFDYLVIATPYHDIASAEWRDAQWIRNIDPFLFWFLKQIPELMFFLGKCR
jgi:hypothetical protein